MSDQLHASAALPPLPIGCVGPRAGLDAVGKINIFPCRQPNPGRQACSQSIYRLGYLDQQLNLSFKWLYCTVISFKVYLVYMMSSIFWNITPYSSSKVSRRFGGKVASILNTEDWGVMFIRNVGWLLTYYTALYLIRQNYRWPPVWEPQILYLIYVPWIGSFSMFGRAVTITRHIFFYIGDNGYDRTSNNSNISNHSSSSFSTD
jgi:hypothetical protein